MLVGFKSYVYTGKHHVYLKPKETLHFELPNISLFFLSLTK